VTVQSHQGRARAAGLSEADFQALVSRPEWFDDAACRGMDTAVFFPTTTLDEKLRSLEASLPCRGCLVRLECLAYGLNEHHGVWGGRSERARRKMRAARTAA
jgi:WhiB family redox-sensing transcriptional regulator